LGRAAIAGTIGLLAILLFNLGVCHLAPQKFHQRQLGDSWCVHLGIDRKLAPHLSGHSSAQSALILGSVTVYVLVIVPGLASLFRAATALILASSLLAIDPRHARTAQQDERYRRELHVLRALSLHLAGHCGIAWSLGCERGQSRRHLGRFTPRPHRRARFEDGVHDRPTRLAGVLTGHSGTRCAQALRLSRFLGECIPDLSI
jgi:hypothetical protein